MALRMSALVVMANSMMLQSILGQSRHRGWVASISPYPPGVPWRAAHWSSTRVPSQLLVVQRDADGYRCTTTAHSSGRVQNPCVPRTARAGTAVAIRRCSASTPRGQTGFRGEQSSAEFQITGHISSSDATDGSALVRGRLSTVHPFSEVR
jgi:hypothetical protein